MNTGSTEFRIPIISTEMGASWYGEKDEITVTDPGLAEEVVRPRKVAGLSKISNELANDSNPASAQVIGDSLGRTIATNIDAALYGNAPGTGNPPKGLGAFTDAQVTLVAAPAAWPNVDPLTEAVYKLDAIARMKLTSSATEHHRQRTRRGNLITRSPRLMRIKAGIYLAALLVFLIFPFCWSVWVMIRPPGLNAPRMNRIIGTMNAVQSPMMTRNISPPQPHLFFSKTTTCVSSE